MALSGKFLVALADYFEDHFELVVNVGGGNFPTAVVVDELRDMLIECEYPKHVVAWAEKIPRQQGQIKRHILACEEQPALLVRFAEDILARAPRPGRYVAQRARAKLLAELEADGYRFENGKLIATTDAATELLTVARSLDRAYVPAAVAATFGAAKVTARCLTDRQAMERTVALARLVDVEDARRPKVAALALKPDGTFIEEARRGELKSGEHAEYTLLERKLAQHVLAGSTVFTTLEPCTSRGPGKVPCVTRLLERKVKRVVIGMVDPSAV